MPRACAVRRLRLDLSTLQPGAGAAVDPAAEPEFDWVAALDPRGMFVTVFLALAGTVAVVVLTHAVLRLVTEV